MMYRSSTRIPCFSQPFMLLSLIFNLLLTTTGQLSAADDFDAERLYRQPVIDREIQQNMEALNHQKTYFNENNGYFFIQPEVEAPQPKFRKTLSQHYADYNQQYKDLNSAPWFMVAKKVAPFCLSCGMFGLVTTANLATLGLAHMYVVSQTVASIFNAGQDIGDAYAKAYGNSTGTATDASLQGLGHLAGGVTMGAIDFTLDMYFNSRIPNIEKLSLTENFARFSKSVAITGKLNKALVAYFKDYLMTSHQIDETAADAMAESTAATSLSFLLTLATYTGIANSQYSDRFVSREQILKVAKVTSEQLARQLENQALQDIKAKMTMTRGQQFGRYVREEIPRASTVTAAYSTFDAMKKSCKLVLETQFIGTSDTDRENLCLGITSITTMGASWFSLYTETWLKPGYLKVYFENIGEAGGLGLTEMSMNLAGIFSEHYYPDQPLVRDTFVMAAGTSVFSALYGGNLMNPDGSFINNARGGAHLMVVLQGSEVTMSHAGPLLLVSDAILMETLNRLPYETDLNLKSDLDTGHYAIPVLDNCMVMSLKGMATESYGLNQGCNVPQ